MRLRKANNRAYYDLVLACQGDIGFDLVDETVIADLPEGDANLAWKKLKERFDSQDAADKVRLKEENENPEDWITQLEIKRTKLKSMGHIISDKDLTVHVLNNLPEEYERKIEQLEKDMEDRVKSLIVLKLKKKLCNKYGKTHKCKGYKAGKENETNEGTALAMAGKFKCRCGKCGNWGHKPAKCPQKNNNAQQTYHQNHNQNRQAGRYLMRGYRKFHGRCHSCGYWGRRKVDFKFLKQDQTEKVNVAKEENRDDESLINDDTMLQNYELNLKNLKDIWIVHSGSSSRLKMTFVDLEIKKRLMQESK